MQNKVVASRKQAEKNVIINVLSKIIVMFLPFATRTVIIYSMGVNYLGLDSLFTSVLNVLSLSELGFDSAIVYSMYKPIADGDNEKVCELLTFFKNIYRMVGLIILVLGLIILPNINLFIGDTSSCPDDINLYAVYLIFLINTCLSYFMFAYRSSILVATMRTDLSGLLDLGRAIIQYGLQLVIIVLFKNYYLYIIILPFVTIISNIARNVIVVKLYPQYCKKGNLPKEDKRDIFFKVRALIGNKIGGMVFTSADSIVVSSFLGLIILGKFSNYNMIFTTVYSFESVAFNAIQPVIGNVLVRKNKDECYDLFKKMFFLNIFATFFCVICFTSLYQPFMKLWVKEDNLLPDIIPILFTIYFYVKSIRRILFMFKEAAGMWREDFWKPYVSVTVNVVSNIIMVQLIGLPGIILSSIAALIFVEIPWETRVFFKKFFDRSAAQYVRYWLYSMLICSLAFVIGTFLRTIICRFIENGVAQIILLLGLSTIVTVIISAFFLHFSPYKTELLKYIKR